jgi:hypothetical protein
VNLNQFAERDFPANEDAIQNDLDNPNQVLYVGDKFGYDYDINIKQASAWGQSVFRYSKVDFFVGGTVFSFFLSKNWSCKKWIVSGRFKRRICEKHI